MTLFITVKNPMRAYMYSGRLLTIQYHLSKQVTSIFASARIFPFKRLRRKSFPRDETSVRKEASRRRRRTSLRLAPQTISLEDAPKCPLWNRQLETSVPHFILENIIHRNLFLRNTSRIRPQAFLRPHTFHIHPYIHLHPPQWTYNQSTPTDTKHFPPHILLPLLALLLPSSHYPLARAPDLPPPPPHPKHLSRAAQDHRQLITGP